MSQERVKQSLEEEKRLHDYLRKLDEERGLDRRLQLELAFKEQEAKERSAFQKVLHETEEQVLTEERRRYSELRGELDRRTASDEAVLIKRFVVLLLLFVLI